MKKTKVNEIISSIKNTKYFEQALTHSSFCNENNLHFTASYENLEFFGDSILNFYTTRYIFRLFPHFTEGQLSKLKQLMVKENTLADLSREVGLDEFLRLGMGEEKNKGRKKTSILADVFESFIAALYLEKGARTTESFLKLTLFNWVKGRENEIWDYKSRLQEHCQAQKNLVIYEHKLRETKIVNGQRLFIVKVCDKLGTFCEQGKGKSKKEAEQEAAEKVIKKLGLEKLS